ncbi:hypothetical protein [Herbiconiux liukaitaii]|uniref:hypothetical protein n=1 Tax=Herbiconiux liukaitaii TaxID=3342799 RepID=UPI0035BA2910
MEVDHSMVGVWVVEVMDVGDELPVVRGDLDLDARDLGHACGSAAGASEQVGDGNHAVTANTVRA